jgi:hypothetical protein
MLSLLACPKVITLVASTVLCELTVFEKIEMFTNFEMLGLWLVRLVMSDLINFIN